ncbi:MAG: flagellar hook-basal body complex protein FliE [Nitrospirae bacterium]|jgi:flagellar hook-basal body complex protein FliE|nr:flagellar hook-basal body complex protein FliE [Nitrospirota bacterium]
MSDIKIGVSQTLNNINRTLKPSIEPEKGFEGIVQEAMGKLSQIQNDAENAVRELTTDGDITQAIISMEKADMTFNLMVEVRNKLLNAYEEIMRMQV